MRPIHFPVEFRADMEHAEIQKLALVKHQEIRRKFSSHKSYSVWKLTVLEVDGCQFLS